MPALEYKVGEEIDIWNPSVPLFIRTWAFIETLKITQGEHIDQPFIVHDFQKDFLRVICDPAYHHALMTLPRGNGKSTFIAAIGVAALCGPLMLKNSRIPVVAKKKKQASIVAGQALEFIEPLRLADQNMFSFRENKDDGVRITNRYSNVVLEAVPADPDGNHGLAFGLAIEDEPAKWNKNSGEETHTAIMGARGKTSHSRVITIGTRPDSSYHWFAKALKLGLSKAGRKAGTYAISFCADKNAEYNDKEQLEKANPLWHHNAGLQDVIRKEIEQVKAGTMSKGYFKQYRMNLGVPEGQDVEYFLGSDCLDTWKACTMPMKKLNKKHPRQGPLFASLDPGGSSSMTAATFYFPATQRFECFAGLPAIPNIVEREKNDKVDTGDYQAAIDNNELIVFPGKETPLNQFVQEFVDRCGDFIPEAIYTDGYKFLAVEQAFAEVKPSWVALLEARRVGRGADGTNDIECTEKEIFRSDKPLKSHKSILMLSGLKEARLTRTTTGYVGLDKSGTRARIDVIQAMILSVGAGHRYRNPDVGSRSQGIDSYVF